MVVHDKEVREPEKKAADEVEVERLEQNLTRDGIVSEERHVGATSLLQSLNENSDGFSSDPAVAMLQEAKRGVDENGRRIDAEMREQKLNQALAALRPQLLAEAKGFAGGLRQEIVELRHQVKQAVLTETESLIDQENIVESEMDPEEGEEVEADGDEDEEKGSAPPSKKRPRGSEKN